MLDDSNILWLTLAAIWDCNFNKVLKIHSFTQISTLHLIEELSRIWYRARETLKIREGTWNWRKKIQTRFLSIRSDEVLNTSLIKHFSHYLMASHLFDNLTCEVNVNHRRRRFNQVPADLSHCIVNLVLWLESKEVGRWGSFGQNKWWVLWQLEWRWILRWWNNRSINLLLKLKHFCLLFFNFQILLIYGLLHP